MNGEARIADLFLRSHPDVAAHLLESMQSDRAAEVLQSASTDAAAIVLARMQPSASANCAEQLSAQTIAELLEKLPSLTAAALLRHFGETARQDVLKRLSAPRAAAVKLLLRYPPNAVGAWMEPRVLTLPTDATVRLAAEKLEQAEYPYTKVFVLDRDRKVRGAVSGIQLLKRAMRGTIAELCSPIEVLWSRESVGAAHRREIWVRESEAPVVNRLQEFIGVVSYADILRQHRQLAAPAGSHLQTNDIGELAELFLGGMQETWRSIGEIIRSDEPTRPRNSQ